MKNRPIAVASSSPRQNTYNREQLSGRLQSNTRQSAYTAVKKLSNHISKSAVSHPLEYFDIFHEIASKMDDRTLLQWLSVSKEHRSLLYAKLFFKDWARRAGVNVEVSHFFNSYPAMILKGFGATEDVPVQDRAMKTLETHAISARATFFAKLKVLISKRRDPDTVIALFSYLCFAKKFGQAQRLLQIMRVPPSRNVMISPVMVACQAASPVGLIKYLIKSGWGVNDGLEIANAEQNGLPWYETPLSIAIEKNNIAMVDLLVSKGGLPEGGRVSGRPACLAYAVFSGNRDLFERVLALYESHPNLLEPLSVKRWCATDYPELPFVKRMTSQAARYFGDLQKYIDLKQTHKADRVANKIVESGLVLCDEHVRDILDYALMANDARLLKRIFQKRLYYFENRAIVRQCVNKFLREAQSPLKRVLQQCLNEYRSYAVLGPSADRAGREPLTDAL